MTAPSSPAAGAGPDQAALREALALWLMAHDESGIEEDPQAYGAHFRHFLATCREAPHSGDCTKESHACVRCTCDRYLARADALLALPAVAATIARADERDAAVKERDESREREKVLRGASSDAEHWAERSAALQAEVVRLRAALEASEYLTDRYRTCWLGKPVRDLSEAEGAYASARAALAPQAATQETPDV